MGLPKKKKRKEKEDHLCSIEKYESEKNKGRREKAIIIKCWKAKHRSFRTEWSNRSLFKKIDRCDVWPNRIDNNNFYLDRNEKDILQSQFVAA